MGMFSFGQTWKQKHGYVHASAYTGTSGFSRAESSMEPADEGSVILAETLYNKYVTHCELHGNEPVLQKFVWTACAKPLSKCDNDPGAVEWPGPCHV